MKNFTIHLLSLLCASSLLAGAQDDVPLPSTPATAAAEPATEPATAEPAPTTAPAAPAATAPSGIDPWEQLRRAAERGESDSLLEMLEQKPDLDIEDSNDEGETALILACKMGHWDTAQMLIEKGANIKASTKIGWTPLLYCAIAQQEDFVINLINKGADIEGRSCLCNSKDCPDIQTVPIKLLQDNISNTPLMWCAMLGKGKMVALLLDRGADISAQGPDGMTALSLAHACNYDDITQLLIDRGASIGMVGGTPLNILISLRDAIGSGHTLSDFVTLIWILSIIAICLFLGLGYYLIHSFHQKWDD